MYNSSKISFFLSFDFRVNYDPSMFLFSSLAYTVEVCTLEHIHHASSMVEEHRSETCNVNCFDGH